MPSLVVPSRDSAEIARQRPLNTAPIQLYSRAAHWDRRAMASTRSCAHRTNRPSPARTSAALTAARKSAPRARITRSLPRFCFAAGAASCERHRAARRNECRARGMGRSPYLYGNIGAARRAVSASSRQCISGATVSHQERRRRACTRATEACTRLRATPTPSNV